jgi:sialic acid synthase SpsE
MKGMEDMIFRALGLNPDEVKAMARDVANVVKSVDDRLKRIEEKLGIIDPSSEGPDAGN